MISFDLKGRTALITGGASGIGLATARILVHAGARVAVNFLPGDARGKEALAELGDAAVAAPGDLGDAAQAQAMVLQAVKDLDGLDLLVNNAGTPGVRAPISIADLESISEELWATLLNVNLMSVFRCSKAAAPALKARGGAIVNTASIAGFGSVASTIVYSASKAAVINLTKNLARSLAPDVRVNAVAPGVVDSPWQIEWTEESRRRTVENTPLKRVGSTADIAEAIVFLGFAGSMITGHTLVIDGGISI